jgi:hypothetical protein
MGDKSRLIFMTYLTENVNLISNVAAGWLCSLLGRLGGILGYIGAGNFIFGKE